MVNADTSSVTEQPKEMAETQVHDDTKTPNVEAASAHNVSVPSEISIEAVSGAKGRKAFIAVPSAIYADDPNYVAPLEFEIDARLNPKANPTLKNAQHQLWVAYKNAKPVGRISALINPIHLDWYKDDAGHFGFIEGIDDEAVFRALLTTAENWMRERGMKKVVGPLSFSVNEETGLLIDGFDKPPVIMMPHARTWYKTHIEQCGYEKAMDTYALSYKNERQQIPERRRRFIERALNKPNIKFRQVDFSRFKEDVRLAIDIFNDAWSENWGYIPFTYEQADHMASELRPILEGHNFVIGEHDGEPVAFAIVLPNINAAIKEFKGKLLPFNWTKLLYRLKVKGIDEARMPLMGVRKKYQGKPLGTAFAYQLIHLTNEKNIDRGLRWTELSWILESNVPMLNMLHDLGGEIYKTHRVFEKSL
ncbi:MAG: hypothetical protein AAF720_03605 [Pseudomonadota bacterium]